MNGTLALWGKGDEAFGARLGVRDCQSGRVWMGRLGTRVSHLCVTSGQKKSAYVRLVKVGFCSLPFFTRSHQRHRNGNWLG